MKVEEFMRAHEGEPGMGEKLTPAYLASQGVTLSDEELEHAAGGAGMPLPPMTPKIVEYRRDEKGRVTHWREGNANRIFYYACPRCKRVTHLGDFGFVYCDPCDTYWNRRSENRVFVSL